MMLYAILIVICLLEISKSQNPGYPSSNHAYYARLPSRYGLYNPRANADALHGASSVGRQEDLIEELDSSSSERDWSQWTEWSLCSRSCGGGVSMRTRRCGLRTLNDIMKECSGEDIQHRICNTEACTDNVDFRTYQCAQYNHRRVFTSSQFEWTAYYGTDVDPCQLACMAVGYNFFKEFGPAQDGTKCFRDKYDICIEGKCLKVGCDQVVGSNLTEDSCGVCGGDNSGCYYYSSLFTKLPSNAAGFDYHEVVIIPAGATRIHIRDESSNYLALMEVSGSHNNYVINGNWVISWPGDVVAAGTVLKYEREDNIETIDVPGPTINNLHVLVLYLGGKISVEYEYWAPTGVRPNQYSALEGVEVTQDKETNEDYYDSLYYDWDVMATSTLATKTTTTTSTTTTTTTNAPTTTTTNTFLPTVPKAHRRKIPDRKKRTKPAYCTPCKKPKSKKKHFCLSDFVIHVRILSKSKVEGHRYRHDITVLSVFKSDFTLMKREYLWVYSNCCPKLRPYKQYLIMGRKRKVKIGVDGRGVFRSRLNATATSSSRDIPRYETRLVVDYMDYWRLWKGKYEAGMNKFANKIKCDGFSASPPTTADRDPEKRSAVQKTSRKRH